MIEQPTPPEGLYGEVVIVPLPATSREISELQGNYAGQYQHGLDVYVMGTGISEINGKTLTFNEWHRLYGMDLGPDNTILLVPPDLEEPDFHQEDLICVHPVSGWLCLASQPEWGPEI